MLKPFQALDTIHTSFPRAIAPYLLHLVPASLLHLNNLYPTFERYYLESTESVPSTSEDEAIELPQLITSIMDFVSSVARGGRAKEWFVGVNATALISAVFDYIQMTDDDVRRIFKHLYNADRGVGGELG